jgi:uroporphyrinogen III methyltransferase/synthase
MPDSVPYGRVYLVGAGPGDPDLITVRGRQCIQQADVLIYDYLASPALLKYTKPSAERIYVGKKGGAHTLSQDGINALIVDKAKTGATVTRLKGGDPFIFGRGGEEAEILVASGIPFEIIPGVTSAIAAPAYAGIPLTHRDFTSTVAFITGHERPDKDVSSIDWSSLANGIGTLVFLMGVKNLPRIAAQLIQYGRSENTPVALIRWGTTPLQVTVTGTLATIVDNVTAAGLKAPAIIVVGEVVNLRQTLNWFETNRPLLGKRVVITRARAQASDLVDRLSALGAECLEFPTICPEAMADTTALDAAINRLSTYDWLVFTSVNGVAYFFRRLFELGKDVRAIGGIQTAVIGPATAERLSTFGLNSDIVPDSYRAEAVVAAFSTVDVRQRNILLPRAAEARPVLPEELVKMGAFVDEVPVYQTRAVGENADELRQMLRDNTIDVVTFTSSSTVKNFKALLPLQEFDTLMQGVTIASIGPITTETAEKLGFNVHVTAAQYTIDGLCQAIRHHFT